MKTSRETAMPVAAEFMQPQEHEIFTGTPASLTDLVEADTTKRKGFSKKIENDK